MFEAEALDKVEKWVKSAWLLFLFAFFCLVRLIFWWFWFVFFMVWDGQRGRFHGRLWVVLPESGSLCERTGRNGGTFFDK